MKLEEYGSYDGIGLADLVREKQISPKELAETALKAITALEPDLGAMVDIFYEEVAFLDETSPPDGPFRGVPFVIKDCLLTYEGKRISLGSRLCEGINAPHGSALMEKFRQSGVVTVGMTKAPEFAYNGTTEPVLYGPTHNPWRMGYSSGGSSGGTASAVSAGYVPIGRGNDGGGSIHIPASHAAWSD